MRLSQVLPLALLGLLACGPEAVAERPVGKPSVQSSDPTLEGNVVRINGITYHCIKYTTVDRGGLWCERA